MFSYWKNSILQYYLEQWAVISLQLVKEDHYAIWLNTGSTKGSCFGIANRQAYRCLEGHQKVHLFLWRRSDKTHNQLQGSFSLWYTLLITSPGEGWGQRKGKHIWPRIYILLGLVSLKCPFIQVPWRKPMKVRQRREQGEFSRSEEVHKAGVLITFRKLHMKGEGKT